MRLRWFVSSIGMLLVAGGVCLGAPMQQAPVLLGNGVIRVDGQAQAGKLVHQVLPVYPPEAKKAGIQGTVKLKALVGKDGRVERLEYVSGPPALVKAAMDAVKQWEYSPTWVNGGRVKVETEIRVIFSLGKPGAAKPESPTAPAQPSGKPPRTGEQGVIHVEGQVQAGKLVHRVMPVYPAEAKHEGVYGTVVLKALIGKDGRVVEMRYVSGPPILVKSAMDAVRQWQYEPTSVKGEPVKVETTITVVFSLGSSHRST
jgi:TonB family protein